MGTQFHEWSLSQGKKQNHVQNCCVFEEGSTHVPANKGNPLKHCSAEPFVVQRPLDLEPRTPELVEHMAL